jgi:hypothetical protein
MEHSVQIDETDDRWDVLAFFAKEAEIVVLPENCRNKMQKVLFDRRIEEKA